MTAWFGERDVIDQRKEEGLPPRYLAASFNPASAIGSSEKPDRARLPVGTQGARSIRNRARPVIEGKGPDPPLPGKRLLGGSGNSAAGIDEGAALRRRIRGDSKTEGAYEEGQ